MNCKEQGRNDGTAKWRGAEVADDGRLRAVARFARHCAALAQWWIPRMIGFWVGFGGAVGAIARFAIGGWVTSWAFVGFPWGTFVVNVVGSAALGFLNRALPAPTASPQIRAFLAIGICGGFTTFSTFDFETLALLQAAQYATAGVYSLGSVVACVAGVLGGLWLAGRFRHRLATEPARI